MGNRKSAQAYLDRVTRSSWWQSHTPGFWIFTDPPPSRVWVFQGDDDDAAYMSDAFAAEIKGEEYPAIVVGKEIVNGDLPALADRWVLLHELGHVMTHLIENDGHHGKQFIYAYHGLVRAFLGPQAAIELKTACKEVKVRLDYRLLLS